jgi:hypothetical protein
VVAARHRSTMTGMLRICVCAGLVLGSVAADEARVTYVLGQEDLTFQPDGDDTYDGEWDNNESYELAAYSNLGWVWGFGVLSQRADMATEDWSLEYESYVLRIYSGQAPVQTESFSWEITGFTGIGMATGDLTQENPANLGGSDRDYMLEFGAQTTLGLTLSQSFVIGAGAGYMFSEVKLDLGGTRKIEQQGLYYLGYASFKF